MRTALFSLVSILVGCSPVSYYFKEKSTERMAPLAPATHVDQFIQGTPRGEVDILFVVDNSRSIEAGLAKFEQTYREFLQLLSRPEIAQVRYRVQLVTTPGLVSPPDWVSRENGTGPHLETLFDSPSNEREGIPIFSATRRYRESGRLMPFDALAAGLDGRAFVGRSHGPLFLVFVLGDDTAALSGEERRSRMEETAAAFSVKRHFVTTTVLSIVRSVSSEAGCRDFNPASRFLETLDLFRWRTKVRADICSANWSSWSQGLFRNIVRFKSRMVLTHPPYEPTSITLQAGARTYRYGDHFTYDEGGNEIAFLPGSEPPAGTLITASYFLQPAKSPLSGLPTPPGKP